VRGGNLVAEEVNRNGVPHGPTFKLSLRFYFVALSCLFCLGF
jgi:hypothetical protein